MSDWTVGSSNLRPIKRLASKIVFSAFRAAWFLAAVPTNRSVSEKETYDGVVRSPISLGIISTVLFFHVPPLPPHLLPLESRLRHFNLLMLSPETGAGL